MDICFLLLGYQWLQLHLPKMKESNTEKPKGTEDMGQVLLTEVLEEVEEGDEDEKEAPLAALGVVVWHNVDTPTSNIITF